MRDWLRTAREGLGLSQKTIAEKLQIKQNYYCEIEQGKKLDDMPLSMAVKLAALFGMTLEEIRDKEATRV